MMKNLTVGQVCIGAENPLALIAGPCVLENLEHALALADSLQKIAMKVGVGLVFKASYDKANRTSVSSYRGPGLDKGLQILQAVKEKTGLPILSDIHDVSQVKPAAEVLDILQIPAFLSRQTDLLVAAGESGKVVNIKKGQFLAPGDMKNVIDKARSTGNQNIMACERGVSFGYNNLVSDMRSLAIMRESNCPVVFDATHSVQLPGGQGSCSGGQREFVPVLARAAVAVGVSGLFMETHPNPDKALSDGPNAWPLGQIEELLAVLKDIDAVSKRTS